MNDAEAAAIAPAFNWPANVDTPATLILSNSAWPSTSRSPLASIAPVNVDRPVTLKFLVVISADGLVIVPVNDVAVITPVALMLVTSNWL